MRRIVQVTPAELSRTNGSGMPPKLDNFGPTSQDIIRFLSIKYRVTIETARAMYYDIFKYIDAEVMRNNESFKVSGFGRFFKRHKVANATTGEMGEYLVVSRRHMARHGTLMTALDDPEDLGPREGREYARVKDTKMLVVPMDEVEIDDE